ncbi:MAG TPA: thioredoxin [candidate division Zixibacteria bacterium]|jgi:thioredoxin 1|nr:thioredoxin [Candidatus Latescibacterota bacterium]MDP7235646.1 thioredoxin [Candidatus Latescibacterota bacterium]HIG47527.1 thioredoxin [candidate division Zixibacteria bacterium]
MVHPTQITDDQFESEVIKSSTPVLVDFWAEWCGPCKAIAPTLEEIAGDYDGRLKVVKVDVDENRQSATQYGIRSIPSLLLFKDGAEVDRIIGALPKKQLMEKIDSHL